MTSFQWIGKKVDKLAEATHLGSMTFSDASVLITGGGRGLGAALARALARRGARVVLAARTRAEIDAVAGAIHAAGGTAHALAADLADKAAVYPLAGAAAALAGPIDLLIHNASTLGPVPLRLLLDTDCEDVERALAVNLLGPFRLTKAVAGSMLVRGRGTVVAITSDAGVEAYPRWGAYGLSKAALEHLMRTFATELEGTGVRFVTVDPGEMRTRMHADAMPDADPTTLADPTDVAERILAALADDRRAASGSRVSATAVPAAQSPGVAP
jgi:NAD(P)-dependent dehydrogenase (short-subunit alcohol dehydrogenase family)